MTLDELTEDSVDKISAALPYNFSNDSVTCQSGRMVSMNKGEWDKSEEPEADFNFHKTGLSESRWVYKPSSTIWVSGAIAVAGFTQGHDFIGIECEK